MGRTAATTALRVAAAAALVRLLPPAQRRRCMRLSRMVARVAYVTGCAGQTAWAMAPAAADAAVASLWARCYASPTFRHDSFEPLLATAAFFPPLIFFFCIDVWLPSVRRSAAPAPAKRS